MCFSNLHSRWASFIILNKLHMCILTNKETFLSRKEKKCNWSYFASKMKKLSWYVLACLRLTCWASEFQRKFVKILQRNKLKHLDWSQVAFIFLMLNFILSILLKIWKAFWRLVFRIYYYMYVYVDNARAIRNQIQQWQSQRM